LSLNQLNNPRIKRGTQREDGLFFICYQKNGTEYWAAREVLDRCIESARRWKEKNREKMLAKQREYQRKNKEVLNEKRRAKFKANPELYRKYFESQKANMRKASRRYYQSKPWVKCTEEARRRAKIKPDPADNKLIGKLYATCARISKCTGIPHHVDHIMPVCAGGEHKPDNLRIITAVENMRKGGRVEILTKDVSNEPSDSGS
jgi:hypothetical protein